MPTVVGRRYLTSAAAAITLLAFVPFSIFAPVMSGNEFFGCASAAQSAHGPSARALRIRLQGRELNRRSEELQRRGRRNFAKARPDWEEPLSSTAFRRWRDSVHEKRDVVTRSRGLLTLRFTTKADPVEEDSYTVEEQTWLPVSETVALREEKKVESTAIPNGSDSPADAAGNNLPLTPDSTAVPEAGIASAKDSASPGVDGNVSIRVTVEDSEVLARIALSFNVELQDALTGSAGGRNGIASDLQSLERGLEAPRRETAQHFLKNQQSDQAN
jgi:hypothetical protein